MAREAESLVVGDGVEVLYGPSRGRRGVVKDVIVALQKEKNFWGDNVDHQETLYEVDLPDGPERFRIWILKRVGILDVLADSMGDSK